jgi:phosphoribosylanthranilate isomerase
LTGYPQPSTVVHRIGPLIHSPYVYGRHGAGRPAGFGDHGARRRSTVLAGGLRPENVADAIGRVGPFGLDVCSGVRTDGRLDPVRLEAFFAAVAAAPS